MYKKMDKYMRAHRWYNSSVHLLFGIGVGVLITYPLVVSHPVRWGVIFIGLGLLGHLYPLWAKK